LPFGFYARHLRANYATLIFVVLAYQVNKSPAWAIGGRNFDFDGVGKGKNGSKIRKRPRGQTHKLCYARLPGL
jgi:hypothetical protein